MVKWFGIGFIYVLPFGYIWLMKTSAQPVEWPVVAFIFAMAIFVTLYATVFKRHIEDTPENREEAMKVIKKAALRGPLTKE